MSKKSPVWPGPSVLVPIPTDILLIGQGDVNAAYTWANLKNDYHSMWRFGTTAEPEPFSTGTCPPVGANLMWTLPTGLRQGEQQVEEGAPVKFPQAPNRWLITRFAYGRSGDAPTATPIVVQGDILIDPSRSLQDINQYPDYSNTNIGVQQIGENVPLAQYDGNNNGNVELKAIGPGDVSWSVSYDNVRNVFALHDDLPDETQTYCYSIIGWYADPESDPLYRLPVDSADNWLAMLEQQFKYTSEDVEQAESDWLAWKEQYGLSGDWDPSKLNLPDQAKEMIKSWHDWQQANGVKSETPDYPTQAVYHSMVATVQWKGKNKSYGTGAPIGGDGEKKLPTLAIANTPESAISIYMATKASEVPGSGITPEDIPNLATSLEAFQRDLLFDLQKDPVWAESMMHDAGFDKKYHGQQWVVVRAEDTPGSSPADQSRAGQQSIPLNLKQTEDLTALNEKQAELNAVGLTISTQQLELYALAMKNEYLEYNRPANREALQKLVSESISAIESGLNQSKNQQTSLQTTISDAAKALQTELGDLYEVKAVDLDPIAEPADPVVLVSGGEMDTKLLPPDYQGDSENLPIRFTGQTITGIDITYSPVDENTITVSWEDLLSKVTLPLWNAFPKEVQGLWLEMLLLDTSNAGLIANIYLQKSGKPVGDHLANLIESIQQQQTACWSQFETQPPTEALTHACGFEGLLPDPVGVAYRPDKNPWTPIFMDWQVKWLPSSKQAVDALKEWKMGEYDYEWLGTNIGTDGEVIFSGRSILNLRTTYNMQSKFTTFKDDPNYQNLPENTIQNLDWVSKNIAYMDLVTQSMSGFTQQLNTLLTAMKNEPLDKTIQDLLGGNAYFDPISGTTDDTENVEPFFPVRSGHFQVMDLQLVDSFGQVLPGKSSLLGPNDPIDNIIWSESLTTKSPNYSGKTSTYGQLPPRLTQDAVMTPRFLQSDNDNIITNSSDSTSPICGWVMANHLDDALMVFDAQGISQGEVIKVRREVEGNDNDLTIRWDAAPGTNTQLGAGPSLNNVHLQGFIHDLLVTGTSSLGAAAYTELMDSIDSTLWLNNYIRKGEGNLTILLGRPLAVVRGEVELQLAGNPAYNQSWFQTGKYFNDNGAYKPTDPAFVSTRFNVRIGDSLMKTNGVIGYFVADDYTTFYSVYGANRQTAVLQQQLKQGVRGIDLSQVKSTLASRAPTSGYVVTNHLVELAANQGPVQLTLLIDPSGDMPITPGSLPGSAISLPNGPITTAMDNLSATFRTGPVLLDPESIQMPTPSEVRGNWSWVARKDVTEWQPDTELTNTTAQATLSPHPLSLIEGWMRLSNFEKTK